MASKQGIPGSTIDQVGGQSAPDKSIQAVREIEQSGQTSFSKSIRTVRTPVVYKLCDINKQMVEAWETHFADLIPDRFQVCQGDIFKEGPAADAIVSPANSFGFMDGGIDMAYSMHFGWQMQERLQEKIRTEYHGELLVGDAVIIPTVDDLRANSVDWSMFNEGKPIKWLISAPTMRVPMDVKKTANAYLAFRAIILAVDKFNETSDSPITSVLCPGLGTAVGRMPADKCAYQMRRAYENFVLGLNPELLAPTDLCIPIVEHGNMMLYKTDAKKETEK